MEVNQSVNKSLLLTVIIVSNFFNPFMGSAVNLALPEISAEFSMNAVTMSWVAMSYLLTSAIFMVPFGKLADIIGRKKIFILGNLVFIFATVLCGFAQNQAMLLSGRLIQGIGSAMTFSTAMAIIISAYPQNIRGRIIGYSVSAVYIGLSAAPLLGGFLIHWFGWRSLFYINAFAGIFIVLAISSALKMEWAEAKNERFDYTGSVIYAFAICTLMYGFSKLPGLVPALLTVTGLLCLVFFWYFESGKEFPVLNINLFRHNRIFTFSNLAALINYAATFGVTFILSLYLQFVKGLSPKDAGMYLVTQPVFMAIVATFSGRLSDKYDAGILASLGMSIIVIGLLILTFLDQNTNAAMLIPALAILGTGFGLFTSPNTNAIMSSVEKKYLGVASATTSTMRITGQLISMAIASLSIHLFIGKEIISPANLSAFVQSVHVVFIVFVILCLFGIYASFTRNK